MKEETDKDEEKKKSTAIELSKMKDKMTLEIMAEAFQRSGYFKSTTSIAQAVVKVQAGQELGIPPFASMKGIHVVTGKLEFDGSLLRALIRRSENYDYKIDELDNNSATISIMNKLTGEKIGSQTFTIDDAKQAELADKDVWIKYPRNMLLNRATSNAVRFFCPDVTMGPAYTLGEVSGGFDVDNTRNLIRPVVRPSIFTTYLVSLRAFIEENALKILRNRFADKANTDTYLARCIVTAYEEADDGAPAVPDEITMLIPVDAQFTTEGEEDDN